MMNYKGYAGSVEYDYDAEIFHGDVINIKDVITFEGKSVDEIKSSFKDSIDDYLEFCASRGEEPDKPFSGKLSLRITPEQHRLISLAAKKTGKSINAWVTEQIEREARSKVHN